MKGIIAGALALLLTGCGCWNMAEVTEYRTVGVSPFVRTTTILNDGYYYGAYGYYDSSFIDYGYNYDYGYTYPTMMDVTTTTVEVF